MIDLPAGIREATPEDIADILRLIQALADYEREPDAVTNTPDLIERWLFGSDPVASALVAEVGGQVVGVAVWYRSYSTWTGTPGIYLEDLFVEPEHRGHGFGKAFLVALARIALDRGYQRFEWVVLDWNQPAIEFYEALGAWPLQEWTTYRVDGDRLQVLSEL
ncbi:GNAT family N-acetyltransferase [Nocardioides humilatus]|uniref:GNAT family N-acetyltransferase n=1 Tax=Nocardioides humilatus TaxID=2607660 RepID=A0A5B1LGC5_9ACTN|nr:GNAT family N-acetyltransferase [Nocardioides humilatus]KAA1418749.1 GNAT family N-acetyltransferase [Nocardioides humilatus]